MAPGLLIVKDNTNLTHWSLETGYRFGSKNPDYPIRVVDSGRNAALDIALMIDKADFEYQCRGFDQGFRVILNLPGETLKLSRNSYRVPVSEDTMISIKSKMTITSKGKHEQKIITRIF